MLMTPQAPFARFLLVTLLLLGGMNVVAAAEEPKPLRVLLVYGGHGFEEAAFFAFWDALPGVSYTKAPLPEWADRLGPELAPQYDVIVLYDMFTGFTPEQKSRFLALSRTPGVGVVALHHSLNSHRDWPAYHELIGGKWVNTAETIDGKTYPPSTYSHDEQSPVTVADTSHPITKGIPPFTIHDETYGGVYIAQDVHVLLKTDHPKNAPAVAWTKPNGPNRLVYLMLGHDAKAWAHPQFGELVARSLRWVSRRESEIK
jgi:type 1 glutamine amidotransferase